ncbi:hypothetical protein K7X08_032599 [Anisodus acutangulus]|uniref:DUS-like FMN-binding domain-containing protein n=1 Tax=Anisodus acutangulus TaxID=402998 RepID=A0A9Q1RR36_9SOLA|nr:hypothetical protein K7X08_032599 [Anisodus acutangulus]
MAEQGTKRMERNSEPIGRQSKLLETSLEFLSLLMVIYVQNCLEKTGADGVLSAESLLENPALFAGYQITEWGLSTEGIKEDGKLDQAELLVDYLKLCEKYPVPCRMIRSHVHKMLGELFRIQPSVRGDFNQQSELTFEFLYDLVNRLRELGVSVTTLCEGDSGGSGIFKWTRDINYPSSSKCMVRT